MKLSTLQLFNLSTLAASLCAAAVPQVSNVRMTQAENRIVTVRYDLDADAVVTLDFETNVVGTSNWISIGGENISGGPVENGQPTGDVWRKVTAGNNKTITWEPDHTWFGQKISAGGIRAKVTAWALDDTPDYMVVSLAARGNASPRCIYYPSASFIPGGVGTNNAAIRTTSLVMRKIKAKGVTWTMGSASFETGRYSDEAIHDVTLTNNYYIGIFEVTQGQWYQVMGSNPSFFYGGGASRNWRPVEKVSYNLIRRGTANNSNLANYPDPPYSGSFLGKLRDRTDDMDFDLPSEAEWEYACRAGHGSGCWGDGSAITAAEQCTNLNRLARYLYNGGSYDNTAAYAAVGPTNGTAIVGTYAPNSWGIYDMHGNVFEWCLDFYQANIGGNDTEGNPYNGRVNAKDGTTCLDGTTASKRVIRGGDWWCEGTWKVRGRAKNCRSAYRYDTGLAPDKVDCYYGLRVVCRAGLK